MGINFTKFVAYLAPVFGAIWALWLGLPNSTKEHFIAWLLERVRRKNSKAKERKPRVLD